MQIKNGRPWRLEPGDVVTASGWPSIARGQVIAAHGDHVMLAFGHKICPMQTKRVRGALRIETLKGYDFGTVQPAKGTLTSPAVPLTSRSRDRKFERSPAPMLVTTV